MTQPSEASVSEVVDASPVEAVRPLATIGVDPGQTWTAAVLRVADFGVHGWTIGPTDQHGTVRRDLLNALDNWDAFSRYVVRLVDALDELVSYAERTYGEVRVAVEVPHVPVGFADGGARRFQRMRLCDWVMPRQVASAVLGQYPEARTVEPDGHGARPAGEYPKELRGTRPPQWGRCEAPRGDRQHERAAYDVAGVAMHLPRVPVNRQ
jgi:hypothetical protein